MHGEALPVHERGDPYCTGHRADTGENDMKAVRYYETGTPDVLRLEDLPKPIPQEDQVLVKVEALGINFADASRRRGDYYPAKVILPCITGLEVVGVIESVGRGVEHALIGQRVFAFVDGGAAEYAVAPTRNIFPFPEGIDPIRGVALFIQGLTAALTLKVSGEIKPGQSVFVEAAGGGVGSLAVQLAKIYRAGTVIGGASTEAKRKFARALGADHVIDHRQPGYSAVIRELTGGKGVDIVLNSSGGRYFTEGIEALGRNGRIVVFGTASGGLPPLHVERLFNGSLTVTAFILPNFIPDRDLINATMAELVDLVRSSRLKLHISKTYRLAEMAEAHRAMESGNVIGKIVVVL
jgi:NADPH2:quinone reductase